MSVEANWGAGTGQSSSSQLSGVSWGLAGSLKSHLYPIETRYYSIPGVSNDTEWEPQLAPPTGSNEAASPHYPVSLVQGQSSPPKTVGLSTESHNLNDMIENHS